MQSAKLGRDGSNSSECLTMLIKRPYCNQCLLFILLISASLILTQAQDRQQQVPSPVSSASYISLDGLTLVITFDRPVNLSRSIESVQQRQAAAQAAAYESVSSDESTRIERPADSRRKLLKTPDDSGSKRSHRHEATTFSHSKLSHVDPLESAASSERPHASPTRSKLMSGFCRDLADETSNPQTTSHLVAGIQLCAQLLTRRTLKLLHNHKIHNCLWASQVQFLVQLNKPIGGSYGETPQNPQPASETVRIAFRRNTLSELSHLPSSPKASNEQEVVIELSRLALEALGLPLSPRLALTGPNQVPPCGQFSISAHLSSPFGTQPNESVRLQWSVERIGLVAAPANSSARVSAITAGAPTPINQAELIEQQWQTLRLLVARQTDNNLVLDARLMQFLPQSYEFRLSVTFVTSLTSYVLNATHQVGRLDFEAPIGTIYGTHLLANEQHLNTNSQLALMADVQIPLCAQNIKQVGLYWQVSDPRVRFEQTYAPIYLAKSGALPEQALVEFRLNSFYGIRVKKFASASTTVATGDSILDAEISDGLLMASIGQPQEVISSQTNKHRQFNDSQLVLFAVNRQQDPQLQQDKFTYQWSCFDGRTAQPCYKSLKLQASSGGTRYDLGAERQQRQNALMQPQEQQRPATTNPTSDPQGATSNLLLVDKTRQRQPILRLPLSWFESDAQLWFGLQRFDRQNPSQHSKTEYALISVHTGSAQQVSIGPVLLGRARQRATIRNPLTGAIVVVAGAPVVIVGRMSPADQVGSFAWRLPNYIHPLHWTTRNITNILSQREEIVTELHLNEETILANAKHQIQLVACDGNAGESVLATISLDVVQGVSQCRVELPMRPSSKPLPSNLSDVLPGASDQANSEIADRSGAELPVMVMVNYCNIPLGLSPLTYQLYTVDTGASDSFIDANRQQDGQANQQLDDYTNEVDEQLYESLAVPLNGPQLSPVFSLVGLDQFALSGLLEPTAATRLRFGVRVCDRLHTCRMFYSGSISLSAPKNESTISTLATNRAAAQFERLEAQSSGRRGLNNKRQQAIETLKGMLEAAKRANTAGNSIAAISILNALMTLAQRMLQQAKTTTTPAMTPSRLKAADAREATSGVSYSRDMADKADNDQPAAVTHNQLDEYQLEQLRDLLQVAMRDCLLYGAQSSQREFHYAESGQTNLALAAMSRILTNREATFELRLRALRLIVLVVRKSIDNQLMSGSATKLQSVPDLKTVQLVYESLFNAISQHTTTGGGGAASGEGGILTQASSAQGGDSGRHRVKRFAPAAITRADTRWQQMGAGGDNNKIQSSRPISEGASESERPANAATEPVTASASTPRTTTTMTTPPHHHQPTSLKANRRNNKEEALLAYLRFVHQAHRSLLQAVAVQLPLGAVQHLEYQSAGSQPMPLPPLPSPSANNNENNKAANKFIALAQPPAYIVSSLTHQTNLISDTIDVDLRGFGSVSVSFGEPVDSVLTKLGRHMRRSQLICRNSTQTKCSSFVLALTSFAGKAPFRSLDESASGSGASAAPRLRVPVVQLDWLSPIDGSNLIDLLETTNTNDANSARDKPLAPSDFKATLTITLPPAGNVTEGGASESLGSAETDPTASEATNYKCYRFDEAANEWVVLSSASEERIPVDEQGAQARQQVSRRLKCSLLGFGVVGLFQGRPPAKETSTELSIALGVACVLAVVTIISLLGCMASKTKSKRHHSNNKFALDASTGSLKASGSSSAYDSDDSIGQDHRQPRPRAISSRLD